MFEKITPEAAGIRAADVGGFLRFLEKNGLVMHNLLLLRGERVFGDFSWRPFSSADTHRMYSQTKSFVGIAIGLLAGEGKLSLDDPIVKFFPDRVEADHPAALDAQTVRQMLTMETCCLPPNWFRAGDPDRVHLYFRSRPKGYGAGLVWAYDSAGSQVLAALAERLAGMPLLDYLKKKLFDRMGTFRTAEILKTPNGDSWGDSALLCTPYDIASFGRLLMQGGAWQGEQLIDADYVREATSPLVDNDECGFDNCDAQGYGYQIWCLKNGFWFRGMGGQFTICIPEKDLICVCTGDNQGYAGFAHVFLAGLNECVVDRMADAPLAADPAADAALADAAGALKLAVIAGKTDSPARAEIAGARYECGENPMGIRAFSLRFSPDGSRGELHYENAQGEKILPFGMGENVFCRFPQLGYSDGVGGARTTNGFTYRCAVSAAWRERAKFVLKAQIIDRYFGNLFLVISFTEGGAALVLRKTAEDFLDEYAGSARAVRV